MPCFKVETEADTAASGSHNMVAGLHLALQPIVILWRRCEVDPKCYQTQIPPSSPFVAHSSSRVCGECVDGVHSRSLNKSKASHDLQR